MLHPQAIKAVTRLLFQREDPKEVSLTEMEDFVRRYPYVAPARLLLALRRAKEDPSSLAEEGLTASLYLHQPLRLHGLFEEALAASSDSATTPYDHGSEETPAQPDQEPGVAEQQIEAADPRAGGSEGAVESSTAPAPFRTAQKETARDRVSEAGPDDPGEIVFQSYHTIDYFASQGIRLQPTDLEKDKFGQQLKSFTEWLRSMKKLPGQPAAGESGEHRDYQVLLRAANSLADKEVLTEAMAEVWAKQGQPERAVAIYEKLSLQYPSKSAYFAARIQALKAD